METATELKKKTHEAMDSGLLSELAQAEKRADEHTAHAGTQASEPKGLALWRLFPSQIKYIVGNEAAERFSYYGMRAILVVFMTQYLLMTKSDATSAFHLFVSACYLLPVVGAFISDRFWGKYKTIMILSSVYCLGHGALALWENKMGLFIGLTLIAMGCGGIKSAVSAHVGDQFTAKNKHLVGKVFDVFYFSVNFGSFFSTLLIPVLLKEYGPRVAFGLPGILMLVATVVFWMGRNLYVHVPPSGGKEPGAFSVILYALLHRAQRQPGSDWLSPAYAAFSPSKVDGTRAAVNVSKIFVYVSVFWALFDQHSSTWVLQAKEMDLNVWGMKMEASQIAALNPIMVMGLIPLFSLWIYPRLEKAGVSMAPLKRITYGMFVAAVAFASVAVYQHLLDSGVKLSVGWHLFPFLTITAAEVMISITGLEFAYTQAPREMKSTIMSLWHLTVFGGNLLTAYIAKINVFEGASFFWFFTVLMAVFAVLFAWAANRYRAVDQMQG
jgi:POT family proton-dependent oligopeptide transporter